nr:uncharacterized protein LOC109172840 isoform X5 [Ipomoea batatas]
MVSLDRVSRSEVISSRDLEPKLLDAAPDSGVLEMQLESHLAKSEGQDALQGDATIYACREDDKSSCRNEMLGLELLGGEW